MRLTQVKYGLSCLVLSTGLSFAAFNVYEFEQPAQEKQFATLIDELRCPKCQNNNLADSNAPLATDIKNYVYQSVKSGKSSGEITDFLISRYGEFVTYRPRNWVIWVAPTLIGLLSLAIAVYRIRRQSKLVPQGSETGEVPDMASLIIDYENAKTDRSAVVSQHNPIQED